MKIAPLTSNFRIPFKSQTVYYDNKVVEEDAATLEYSKSYFSNPVSPSQDFIGFNLIRDNKNTILLKSRYNHVIGTINHDSAYKIPKINVIAGSHQPVVELVDNELGIKILINRGSELTSPNLNISYDKINEKKIFVDRKNKISFGNNLYVVTGYKSKNTEDFVRSYFDNRKNFDVEKSAFADKIKNDYSIVGLAAGYGTRLKPVSDLDNSNKPTTSYPSGRKNLMEISCLDTAARGGDLQKFCLMKDDEKNLSGTAGAIIRGLKNGTIPRNKPLVLLTSDTFNNIDLAKVLYDFEQSKNTGIGVVLKDVSQENLYDVPLVKVNPDSSIEKFYYKINSENYRDIICENNHFFTSTNIMVIHPKILEILKDFSDENNKAEFLDFLGLMLNTLNKEDENLMDKYPDGLGNKILKLGDLTFVDGYPKRVYGDNGYPLKVNAIMAKDIKGRTPRFSDIGSIEKFIETIHDIKNSQQIDGINSNFLKRIKENVDDNGLIFMQPEAREKFEIFKQKYNIKNLKGNVIISSFYTPVNYEIPTKKTSDYVTLATENPKKFVEKIMTNSEDFREISKEMIDVMGLPNFLKWYLSNDGYYGAYEKYVDNLYKNAKSIDELLKFMPNWSSWKLEEKFWRLNNPGCDNIEEGLSDLQYRLDIDKTREQPFTIGKLPYFYFNKKAFNELISKIRTANVKDGYVYTSGPMFKVKRLKGGDLNDKFIYKITSYGKDFILKTDRSYAEDNDSVWMYDKKTIKKNKVLMADSNFTNACISRYLELNGCKNIPKLLFYDFKEDVSLYEYVEDCKGDLFQQGKIDTEYSDLNLSNDVVKNLRKKGIYLNDTALKNFFTEIDGTEKIIDLGHANFIMPFKPGVKHYNVEFANINGPDLRTIYASLL